MENYYNGEYARDGRLDGASPSCSTPGRRIASSAQALPPRPRASLRPVSRACQFVGTDSAPRGSTGPGGGAGCAGARAPLPERHNSRGPGRWRWLYPRLGLDLTPRPGYWQVLRRQPRQPRIVARTAAAASSSGRGQPRRTRDVGFESSRRAAPAPPPNRAGASRGRGGGTCAASARACLARKWPLDGLGPAGRRGPR